MNVQAFGVREYQDATTPIDRATEEIALVGYTIVRDVLNEAQLRSIRAKLDKIYEEQCAEVGGENCLREINDAFTVRCPLAYDDEFLQVATQSAVLSIIERLLGEYFTLMLQNGI